ncbi:MAG TPA: TonB C-terminal domain-containing protein [Gemmatimonadaceae bacterium]|nr:TonB C-terminal domain-containing protein [Gemmatimonadaceae bacterium]
MRFAKQQSHLGGPLGMSLVLHLSILALALFVYRNRPPEVLPPFYRVDLVGAPKGERAIGEVKPAEAEPVQTPPAAAPVAPPAAKEKAIPLAKAVEKKTAARSTPVPTPAKPAPKTPAPKAGGGPVGDVGSDVATVHVEGIDFPFPGYLQNIQRQVILNFKPSDTNSALRAEVLFLIYRDGSVKIVRFVTRSHSYAFDLEAQGSIEAAARNFGRLPDGFRDDVLPVYFNFDPRFIR